MTREEAKEYANKMTYRDAVYYALQGKCIPYRKATLINCMNCLIWLNSRKALFRIVNFSLRWKVLEE